MEDQITDVLDARRAFGTGRELNLHQQSPRDGWFTTTVVRVGRSSLSLSKSHLTFFTSSFALMEIYVPKSLLKRYGSTTVCLLLLLWELL
jgi:hypothetical protein